MSLNQFFNQFMGSANSAAPASSSGSQGGLGSTLGNYADDEAKRILFKTGTFPDPEQWNDDFAYLDPGLVRRLGKMGVVLVGIDTPSVDAFDSKDLPSHHAPPAPPPSPLPPWAGPTERRMREQRQVRHDVAEVAYAQDRSLVGEFVVRQVLGKRRAEQEQREQRQH